MSWTAADIAAYIGAAAWLPQIASWVHTRFVRPLMMIIPNEEGEVGFSSFGPIFNVRMAFTADRKDAIIDGFELVVTHSEGETKRFRWAGLSETFSEIRDDAGNRQVVSRDHSPIALKIGRESLVEKFVRFQEPKHHETVRPLMVKLVSHFNFMKQSGDPDYVAKVLASKELYEVIDARKKSFCWKAGTYTAQMNLSSPAKFSLPRPTFTFDLTAIDVEHLRQNLANLDAEIQNVIKSNLPDFQMENLNWNWATVTIKKGAG